MIKTNHDGLTVNKADLECLCSFIPYFESKPTCKWDDEVQADGVHRMPFPRYDDEMQQFVKTVYDSEFIDTDYFKTLELYEIKRPPETIQYLESAPLPLVCAVLTWYIRGERFCNGLWCEAIENSAFLTILQRLKALIDKEDQHERDATRRTADIVEKNV